MDERETALINNIKEYHESAMEAYAKQRFNAATTLFFKTIAALCDLKLFREEATIPSSHAARFRILQERYPSWYDIADRDFPFYQDSYTQRMNKEAADLLREDATHLKEELGIR